MQLNITVDFEITFAPEIEAFTPPQPINDTQVPMTPSLISPITPRGHQHTFSSASANGTAEVTTMQPVSLRQSRGARLSFLGGRKKEHQPPPSAHMNGGQHPISEADENPPPKTQDSRRTSFFRSHSFDNNPPSNKAGYNVSVVSASNGTTGSNGPLSRSNTDASDWVTTESGGGTTTAGSRGSHDTRMMSGTPVDSIDRDRESAGGAATPKLGGVKKRLSLLKLGTRKTKNNGMMGALNEE